MIYNGIIQDYDFVIEDHGFFLFSIDLETECGYVTLSISPEKELRRLFDVLKITSLKQIIKMPVRVKIEDNIIRDISHFINDKWLLNY